MKHKTRGQAAMEFLMTYGWALLIVLIAVAALAYFGVLNPSRFLPEQCTGPPGIACLDFRVYTSSILVRLENSMGESLTTFQVNAVDLTPTGACAPSAAVTFTDGTQTTYNISGCGNFAANSQLKAKLTFNYTSANGFVKYKEGKLVGKVVG